MIRLFLLVTTIYVALASDTEKYTISEGMVSPSTYLSEGNRSGLKPVYIGYHELPQMLSLLVKNGLESVVVGLESNQIVSLVKSHSTVSIDSTLARESHGLYLANEKPTESNHHDWCGTRDSESERDKTESEKASASSSDKLLLDPFKGIFISNTGLDLRHTTVKYSDGEITYSFNSSGDGAKAREQAAREREQAAREREQAAREREYAARAREQAAREREQASRNRQFSDQGSFITVTNNGVTSTFNTTSFTSSLMCLDWAQHQKKNKIHLPCPVLHTNEVSGGVELKLQNGQVIFAPKNTEQVTYCYTSGGMTVELTLTNGKITMSTYN